MSDVAELLDEADHLTNRALDALEQAYEIAEQDKRGGRLISRLDKAASELDRARLHLISAVEMERVE